MLIDERVPRCDESVRVIWGVEHDVDALGLADNKSGVHVCVCVTVSVSVCALSPSCIYGFRRNNGA